jgi:hypothetical protein
VTKANKTKKAKEKEYVNEYGTMIKKTSRGNITFHNTKTVDLRTGKSVELLGTPNEDDELSMIPSPNHSKVNFAGN